jgi:hypothetical protein
LVFSVGKTVFSLSELPHHQINVWYTAVVPNGGPVFSQLVPGERYCGLRRHGGIVTCWGNYAPLTPAGAFTQVSSSGFSLCGLRPNGTITCWGSYPPDDLLHPPRGVFAQVAVAESGAFACGLHRNGTVQCWWAGKLSGSFFLPTGTFTRIAVSGDESGIGRSYIGLGPTVCGLLADRTVACSTGQYYENSPGMSTITIPAVRFSLAGTFSQLVGGFDTLCGLHTDGTTACVSRGNPNDMSVPLAGMYTELAEGGNDICGVATDGSVDCEVVYQALPAPPGVFIQILPGDDYDCGLHPDGTVTCWVNSNPPKISPSDGGGDVPTQ